MKDPRYAEFEALRVRAVTLGETGGPADATELKALLRSEFPTVRRAAAGAWTKLLARSPSLSGVVVNDLMAALETETGDQTAQYMLRAMRACAESMNAIHLDFLRDLARDPTRRDYVHRAAAETLAAGETAARAREALLRHWCTRCRRPVTAAESAAGIDAYGKPYCRHCLTERRFEDLNFRADVEKAKRLRVTDGTAVQSGGEKAIGDWLVAHRIDYRYDERIVVAGDIAMRPDFYLPEFDVYIEYWGMDTPEYREKKREKRGLYRRDGRKLVSLYPCDIPTLDAVLTEKLGRYFRVSGVADRPVDVTVGDYEDERRRSRSESDQGGRVADIDARPYRWGALLLFAAALSAFAAGADRVPSVAEIPAPGRVRPIGWLRDTMCAARDGYTARMDDVDVQFRKAWAATTQPRGKDVHWWANPGSWSAEGGAYWFDGLVKMAFQLDDPALKAMASNRLETVLTKTNPDSWGFLWWLRRDNPEDVAALKGDAFLLANSEKLVDTIAAWYEATGDVRAKRALHIAFTGAAFELYKPVRGAYEAWRVTGDPEIARLLDAQICPEKPDDRYVKMGGRYGRMPPKYLAETLWLKYRHEQLFGIPTRHGLGASWGIYQTLRRYQWTGDADLLKTVRAWCAFLDTHCRQPYGAWVMDEEWGWAGADRATETCTVACENALRLALLAALGEGAWADDLEESVYNTGPNCTTADFGLHTYMQQPNRTRACDLAECSHGGDGLDPSGWKAHGLYARKHAPLCCTAGLNRIWPDFVQGMWLETRDGGVAAALYGPCTFETTRAGGRFAVREATAYPFEDVIRFTVEAAPAAAFPFSVRIPRWCTEYEVAVNGIPANIAPVNGFARLERVWRAGDTVTVTFPMTPRYATLTDRNPCARGEAAKTYGYLKVGSLLFAQRLPMKDANTPLAPGAVPPALAPADAVRAELVRRPPPPTWSGAARAIGAPFRWDETADAPLKLRVRAADGRTLELVPYGAAKFRVSLFPVP